MNTLNELSAIWHEVATARSDDLALVETASASTWSFRRLREAAEQRSRALAGQRLVFPVGHDAGFVIETLAAWAAGAIVCPLEKNTARPAVPAPEEWPAGVVMAKTTSGTSGAPKLVLFDAAALAADARQIVGTMALRHDLPNIAAISLAHSYGFSNLVLPLILHGVPLRLADSPLPESVRAAIGAEESIALPGVPAMWRAWEAAGLIDSRIALAISAGAPLPLDLEQRVFATAGVKIHNFLGASECGGIAYDRTATPRAAESLAGTAMDDVRLALDGDGVLEVHSAAVGAGYWPGKTPDSAGFLPGRFRTTDLAELRNDGCHLLGRSGEVVNLAGRKLHPAELESLLRQHPAVRECVVFGIPSLDRGRGEELVACVAPTRGGATNDGILSAWLVSRLPPWKLPRHWWLCDTLRTDIRGKLSRPEWRAAFLAHQREGPPSA